MKIPAMEIGLQDWDNHLSRAERATKRAEELARCSRRNDGSLPKFRATNPEEASLAAWVNNVATKHRSGTLAPEMREELMKISAMAIRLQKWDHSLNGAAL